MSFMKEGLLAHLSLQALFTSFPDDSPLLTSLQSSLLRSSKYGSPPPIHSPRYAEDKGNIHWGTWEENWGLRVRPLILSDLDR